MTTLKEAAENSADSNIGNPRKWPEGAFPYAIEHAGYRVGFERGAAWAFKRCKQLMSDTPHAVFRIDAEAPKENDE